MKKLTLVAYLCLAFATISMAAGWHVANQTTIGWDAVTQDIDGNTITDGVITYNVYLTNAKTDPGKTNPVKIADGITNTQYTITLNTRIFSVPGVTAVFTMDVDGEIITNESDIIYLDWTTDNPKGILYLPNLKAPTGLGIH